MSQPKWEWGIYMCNSSAAGVGFCNPAHCTAIIVKETTKKQCRWRWWVKATRRKSKEVK